MSRLVKKIKREVNRVVNQATGHEHRKNKKRARQVQVIRQQNEQVQVFTVTLQTEEEVPDVANPSEIVVCAPDQHCWKPIESPVTVESNGVQVAVAGAHKYEVKGYRHTKVSYSSHVTTKEIITTQEWRSSSRWFGLQKIREYSRWTRSIIANYTVEKDASSTIAIIECKICKQQLEFNSDHIKEFYNCLISNPEISQLVLSDSPVENTTLSTRSESGSLATRCQRHEFDINTMNTIDMRYVEANVTQALKMDSNDNYQLVWLNAPTTKVTQDVKASVRLFKCKVCGVYATPQLSKKQLEDLARMIPNGDSLLKRITM